MDDDRDIEQLTEIDHKVQILNQRFVMGRDIIRAHRLDPMFIELTARRKVFTSLKLDRIEADDTLTACINNISAHCDELGAYLDGIGVPRLGAPTSTN